LTTEPAVRAPERRTAAAPARPAIPATAATAPVATAPAANAGMPGTTLERMPPILEAHNLAKRYRLGASTVDALQGVSLAVDEGEFVALMGPSGSGKSTLLQLLGGLDRPTAGEVVLQGEVVSALDDDAATKLRRDRTGFVFQSFNLIPLLDVAENVMLPFTISGSDRSQEIRDRVADVIALVDLAGKEHHKPDQLSAGEQQRVAIARALVTRPALLFADEPTGNLDYTTGTEILEALWRSCVERRQTIVLVTHDSKAAAYADRVLVISDGRIRDEILLGRRRDHDTAPLVGRLAELGL
jgi:putative ABC transport system ATP-binding protein